MLRPTAPSLALLLLVQLLVGVGCGEDEPCTTARCDGEGIECDDGAESEACVAEARDRGFELECAEENTEIYCDPG